MLTARSGPDADPEDERLRDTVDDGSDHDAQRPTGRTSPREHAVHDGVADDEHTCTDQEPDAELEPAERLGLVGEIERDRRHHGAGTEPRKRPDDPARQGDPRREQARQQERHLSERAEQDRLEHGLGAADDAAEPDVGRRRVDALGLPRSRSIAVAVVGGAQVRATLRHRTRGRHRKGSRVRLPFRVCHASPAGDPDRVLRRGPRNLDRSNTVDQSRATLVSVGGVGAFPSA